MSKVPSVMVMLLEVFVRRRSDVSVYVDHGALRFIDCPKETPLHLSVKLPRPSGVRVVALFVYVSPLIRVYDPKIDVSFPVKVRAVVHVAPVQSMLFPILGISEVTVWDIPNAQSITTSS